MNWHLVGQTVFWSLDGLAVLLGALGWKIAFIQREEYNRMLVDRDEWRRRYENRGGRDEVRVQAAWEEAARWEARYRRQLDLCQNEHVDRPLATNPLTPEQRLGLEAELEEMF